MRSELRDNNDPRIISSAHDALLGRNWSNVARKQRCFACYFWKQFGIADFTGLGVAHLGDKCSLPAVGFGKTTKTVIESKNTDAPSS